MTYYKEEYTLHNGKKIYALYDDHNVCKVTKECIKALLDLYQQGRTEVIGEIERAMYHEAFEVSHEEDGMQKWDSGNWIRYKLFENVIEQFKEQEK